MHKKQNNTCKTIIYLNILTARYDYKHITEPLDHSRFNEKYQYSLRDLSPMTGLSPSMLCRLFNGERKFLSRHKLVITKIFNVDESSIKWPQKKYKTR